MYNILERDQNKSIVPLVHCMYHNYCGYYGAPHAANTLELDQRSEMVRAMERAVTATIHASRLTSSTLRKAYVCILFDIHVSIVLIEPATCE